MDPRTTWEVMMNSFIEHDWMQLRKAAEDLQEWMKQGGCPPEIVPGRNMGTIWNGHLVASTCDFAISLTKRVLDDPNGIPEGVPFSLSCCECDVDGAATFEESIAEGWTRIEFTPVGVAENFLGLCPEHSRDDE